MPNPEISRNILKLHNALKGDRRHAFDCDGVFARNYSEALRDNGSDVRAALKTATKAHDQAVTWTYDNVGLD